MSKEATGTGTVREVRLQYVGRPRRLELPITYPVNAYRVFWKYMGSETVEVFGALALNGRHHPVQYYEVSRGTVTASLVHPREVFRPAIHMGAAAVMVAHNHPSGDSEPSTEDRSITKRLLDAGQLIGIPLLDHLVITATGWQHAEPLQQQPERNMQ
jgi:DNA repair protein RadC